MVAVCLGGSLIAEESSVKAAVDAQSSHTQKLPPNVILIIGDDMTFEDFGCYGNTAASTPNIDQLATDGIRFNQAYCTEVRHIINEAPAIKPCQITGGSAMYYCGIDYHKKYSVVSIQNDAGETIHEQRINHGWEGAFEKLLGPLEEPVKVVYESSVTPVHLVSRH